MTLETNLNESPYFDDYEEAKNFHRVLFRPGYAVQARELTQLQTILQNQVERFANEVLVNGTVVSGISLTTNRVNWVRIKDRDANNTLVIEENFLTATGKLANAIVVGETSGMIGRLVAFKQGTEQAFPSTSTIYVDYVNSGSNNTSKSFLDDEVLVVKNYSSNAFIAAATSYSSNSTGVGLKVSATDGIIYHKGVFIRTGPQSAIAGRYTTVPDINIGFETRESTVNSFEDSSLYDNASGSTNAGAPGADRLKLTPVLTTRPLGSSNTETFFTVSTLREGELTTKIKDTTYSDIGDYIDTKFFETNGNFAVEPFNIRIREHLKNSTNLGRYSAADEGDADLLVASIEDGLGYVGGKRTKLHSPVPITIEKATTVETNESTVIGQAIGSYVICDEVAGQFDVQGLRGVYLYDTAHKAVSSTTYATTGLSGQSIGTAYVRGVQYNSGDGATPTGQYRIYISDINMAAGHSFTEVRSVIMNSQNGQKAFADVVLEGGNASIKDSSLSGLVFPFAQSGTKTLRNKDNAVETQFVFRNESTITFTTGGTSTVSSNTAHSGGTNVMNDTGTLTTPDEKNIIVVATSTAETGDLTGTISDVSTTLGVATVTGSLTTFQDQYVVGDIITFNSESAVITKIDSQTSLECQNDDSQLTDGSGLSHNHKMSIPNGKVFDLANRGTIVSTTNQHSISLFGASGITLTGTFTASVLYNTLRTDAIPASKVINKNKFVKLTTSSHPSGSVGPWSLGVSDITRIRKVYKASSGVTTSSEDVTSHFILDDGQKDTHYATSKLIKKSTSSLDVSNSELLVEFDYFGRDISSGTGFLCADSYPIDDANADAADKMATADIPLFISPTSGKIYDLRDSIDFRPYTTEVITPTATAGSAPNNPGIGSVFSIASTGAHTPTPDENFQTAVQFYLPRKDRVTLSSEGTFEITQGVPSRLPRVPEEKASSMTLAVLDIPPYPSLSPYVAKAKNRPDYQVRVNVENNRRYVMRDIRVLDRRLKNVEYYSSLNALELSARNKQIFNGSGLDRFKNGFLVDNFVGHNVADTTREGYRAAIDKTKGLLRPTFQKNYVEFEDSSTGLVSADVTTVAGRVGNETYALNHTSVEYVSQPYATKQRNPVQELTFNWTGEVNLFPSMDNATDINTLPDVQLDFDGMYDSFVELANRTGVTGTDWGGWETSNTDRDVNTRNTAGGGRVITTTTQTSQIRNGVTTTVSPAIQSFDLGTRTTNVAIRDYMRSKTIKFQGIRMRPDTRVWPFFDGEDVSAYVSPSNENYANTGSVGSELITDHNGNVFGHFTIPNDDNLKFRIGSREFKLLDIEDPLREIDTVTTSAKAEYTSVPVDVDQQKSIMNIKVPQFVDTAVTSSRRLTSVRRQVIPPPPPPPRRREGGEGAGVNSDPIAQSFFVSAAESDGIFVTELDLFFAKRSVQYPITIQIREMENGTPTSTIVPFGSTTRNLVEISADASVATTFTFDSPVFLKNGKDYCFVIIPAGNSDEFRIWTAELGGTDITSNLLVDKAPAAGVMMTSSNDTTWSVSQKEDIKFVLRKAKFQTNVDGLLYLQNKNYEFFNTQNKLKNFMLGEKVSDLPTMTITGITGNTTALATGNYINLTYNSFTANAEVISITSDDGAGEVELQTAANYGASAWVPAAAAGSNVSVSGTSWTGTGTVDAFTPGTAVGFAYYEDQVNSKLHLVDSNGGFSANSYVVGQTSGARAQIESIYNVPFNALVPKLPTIEYSNTSVEWTVRTTSSTGVISDTFVAGDNGKTTEYLDSEKQLYSRSNEVGLAARNGTNKSLLIRGKIRTSDPNVSPIVDASRLNVLAIGNSINNDATDEHKEVGNSEVRHISKIVELSDGNEAEDIKVFVSAWKPSGTDVKVYARIHNPEDPEGIYEKDYTPLTVDTSTGDSDSVNREDYKEYEYSFSANTDGQNFLAAASANSHARLNTSDDEVVWYMNSNGSKFNGFKSFAIKIVMTSTGTQVVPLVRDMRVIALQK